MVRSRASPPAQELVESAGDLPGAGFANGRLEGVAGQVFLDQLDRERHELTLDDESGARSGERSQHPLVLGGVLDERRGEGQGLIPERQLARGGLV